MTGKIKRRSLRCGGRPKADFGSIFTTFIAPALGVAGSVADSAISKTQVSKSNTKPAVKETNTEVTNNNTSVENLPTIQVPTKEPISGLVTSNTVIPPDPTKTPAMRLGGRKKCWIGAAIMGATSIAGSLFGAAAQKREMRRQKNIQDWQNTTQEAANMTTALNNSQDYQEDYLRQFRTAARLGKTLGAKGIYITDGGDATKIGNNTYLLRGGSHEDVNETGQTGIGINVGGNEVEAEGGEVAQKKNGALRIFSAQPILSNGMSPAQAILRGYNKDKVFSQQQAFKKRNGLKDDGSKAQWGMGAGTNRALQMSTKNGTRSIRSMWNSAKGPLSYMPIVGTAIDGYNLINNPSKSNAVNFGVGLISDLLGYKWLKQAFATPVRRTVNLTHRGRVPAKVAAGVYSGGANVIDTELNYLQNKKRLGGRAKARIGTEKTYGDENKTNIATSNLNGAEYLSKIISGAIMQGGRLLTGNARDKSASNNVAQDTYLMPFRLGQGRAFKDAGYDRDYQSEKKRDYGLVQKAVGNENIPIYSRVNNPEKRKELIQIYNPESTYNPNIKYPLIHAAFHPSSLYIDGTNGNIMYKGWDLNDYGTDKGGRGFSSYYGSIRKALANTLDTFGHPTVVTTGYQNVLDNDGKPMNIFKGNYKDDYNANMAASDFIVKQLLKKENPSFVNEYGMSPIPEVVITAPRKKHKLGGGLNSKDRGSSKHPYPSVSSKDFAGGGRSYPIPTKADAVDALRLAGLHGRSDVRSKVYNKYPSLRKKSLLGSSNRPVKGMRPKAAIGIYTPFNKRYTSIYDTPDYDSDYNGGNVLGNGEVTITAKRIKPTFMKPNNDAMNLIKVPKEEVPYIPQHHNRSRTIFSSGDYLGLGIDTLAALSTGLVNYNTAGKYTLPDRAPIIQASKLPTTYNVNPEIEEVKRYRDRLTGQTFNNTSSSVAALNRSGAINLDALSNLSKLWATKENEENKMLTEDAKNQQTVAAQNVQNELARQSEIARIKNEATQAKGDALNVGLSGLSQAWTNFWTAGRTAYEDDQSRRAMIASSKDATPTRLMEMDFDLSPDVIASLYRNAKEDRTKRFYLSRLSPKQRQKYGIN